MTTIRITFGQLNAPGLRNAFRAEAARRKAAENAKARRTAAAVHEESARESFNASDTDGFRSQWAHTVCAREERLTARIAEDGGVAQFPALFDLNGNLVPARRVMGQFGWTWELLSRSGKRAGWFTESKARSAETRRRNNAAKGFYVGAVRAPAEAATREGEVRGVVVVAVRTDGGWSPDVAVVDNGK